MSHPDIDPCLALHRAYTSVRRQLDEELGSHHGIDFDDFVLLHALALTSMHKGDAGIGLGALAAEAGASRAALMRRLRPLEKTGLVACDGPVAERRIALRAPGFGVVRTARETVARVCARPAPAREALLLADALSGWRAASDAYHRMGAR